MEQNTQESTEANNAFLQRVKRAAWAAYCYFSFAHVKPLLDKGTARSLDELSAKEFHPARCNPQDLLRKFNSRYSALKDKGKEGCLDVGRALLWQEWTDMTRQILWVAATTTVRFAMAFLLRAFLMWLQEYRDDEAGHAEGWLRGLLLLSGAVVLMLVHHQPFWIGFLIGYRMRTTMTAAVHAKLLMLNTSRITHISTGHIITLVSNDAQRFDWALVLWPYLMFGPLEAILVTAFVAHVLGPWPAFAGMGCTLLIIPIQAVLSKYIAKCRFKTTKITDKRINLTSELISGNLAVKMLGWEQPLLEEVTKIRNDEHRRLTIKNYIRAGNQACPNTVQLLGVAAMFITVRTLISVMASQYRFTDGEFELSDVFFALSLMMLPTLSLADFFVAAVEFTSEAVVAAKRLDAFLKTPEPPSSTRADSAMETGSVEVHGGDYGWLAVEGEEQSPASSRDNPKEPNAGQQEITEAEFIRTLQNVDVDIKPGELVGIVGRVGNGKSSLLRALLGDMEDLSKNKSTVRANILFGQSMDQELYNKVITSCALDVDLEQLPDGDDTEIGERGINLSGGQKARLALARAAYSRSDVTLLDDPLSAVDARVGRLLFDRCIGQNGMMKHSTRLLVTHQKQFLPKCDKIVLINDGRIEAAGTWDELVDHEIIKAAEKAASPEQQTNSDDTHATSSTAKILKPHPKEQESANDISTDNDLDPQSCQSRTELVQAERKEIGRVSAKVYWAYILHIGLMPFVNALILLMVAQALVFVSEWWIARWAASQDGERQRQMKWVWTLIAFAVTGMTVNLISVFVLFTLIVRGSTRLHNKMIRRVMRAPLKFFHTNPVGRILNRFSKDMGLQDEELPYMSAEVLANSMIVLGTFFVVAIALPYMAAVFLVIFWIFWRVRVRYVVTSREVKRFDGITRSPVYAMLSANLKGLPTIRAYERQTDFQDQFLAALDLNGTWWTAFLQIGRWVGVKMDVISILVMSFSVVLALVLSDQVSPEVLGLALTYTVDLSDMLQWTMRQSADLENTMTAVERNMEYTKLEQEPLTVLEGGVKAPKGWPVSGQIDYERVSASYRPGLSPVLRNLTFSIPGSSSVGIVGRTGSGKSSLLLTLFRLIDLQEGVIKIDGLDTASIGVDALRKQLAVIPQDPVLFSGTLRSNLDLWNEQSDAKIWAALHQVCLDSVANEAGGLDAPIAECGSNFSVGQRQLLCLARALLTDAKILALDEATANVDSVTDELIQSSLHSLIHESSKTLLIIAHRIDTVMGCDLILVLEGGLVVEFGSPSSLLGRQNGIFTQMVHAARQSLDDD